MRQILATLGLAAGLAGLAALPVAAAPSVGQPAPSFQAVDATGQAVSLDDLRGKTVVLEWTNHECPFVKKHYGAGNMQAQQTDATGDGVVWLQVITSPPGEQGYADGPTALKLNEERQSLPSGVLLDPEGTVGRAFAAQTTPHMYIIDGEGLLVYMGGIDSIPSANPADIEKATPYVREALEAIAAGEAVPNPVTRPYGCAVKYAS